MLNKETLLFLFLLLLTIRTITSVSASDATDDILNNASSDEMGISEENINEINEKTAEDIDLESDETLKSIDVGTFDALQLKIDTAKEGSEITLENDYFYTPSSDTKIPTISKSLTINGNGHVIDGIYQSALFRISGYNKVVLNNIKFKNGYNPEVIVADGVDELRIKNCEFIDNEGFFGNALFIKNTRYLEISNCEFTNNNGLTGPLFINNTKNIFILENTFDNNYASFGGAICILSCSNSTYIGDSVFTNNYANQTGGAIYLDHGKYYVIDKCTFTRNVANNGGAISLISTNKADIYGSTFSNNQAMNGGAVKIENTADLYILGNNFNNNHANYGSAIHFLEASDGRIYACDFISNSGLTIYADKSNFLHFHSCDFVKNSADGIGAMSFLESEIIIEYTNFTSNKGSLCGGIVVIEGYVVLNKCIFSKNTADSNGFGAIYGGTLVDCKFTGNTAPQYAGCYLFYHIKLNVKQSGSTCDDKTLIITVKNAVTGSVIANEYVKVSLNGRTIQVKTNTKGQATVKINFPAKQYTVTVKCGGNGRYIEETSQVKVVIKKATPRITAAKKIFKRNVKTKAYSIILKNSKGAVMKNANVKLSVGGKTYSAKTNAKGQAIFKITKLNKIGNFKATIRFAANSYYNSASKNIYISVRR